MVSIYNNNQLEKIILLAAKLPTMGIKYISKETGINLNTLYQ